MGQAKHFNQTRFSLPNEGWILQHFVNMNWQWNAEEPYYVRISQGSAYSPAQWALVDTSQYKAAYTALAIFNMAKTERTVRIRHKHTATLKYLWSREKEKMGVLSHVPISEEREYKTDIKSTDWVTRTITVPAAGVDAVPEDRQIRCDLKVTSQFTKQTMDVPLSAQISKELFATSRKYGVVFVWLEQYHQRFLSKSKDVHYEIEILGRKGLPVQAFEGEGITIGSVYPW